MPLADAFLVTTEVLLLIRRSKLNPNETQSYFIRYFD
jgi:hypothetical protein